jgi:hypothetical protein
LPEGIVEVLLARMLVMIGYYLVILTSAMILIVLVIQVFKSISKRARAEPDGRVSEQGPETGETTDESIAAIAAVGATLMSESSAGVSAWSRLEAPQRAAWKVSGRSQRILQIGG